MRKDFIVLPSVDGAEFDIYVLPPQDTKSFSDTESAKDFVTNTIKTIIKKFDGDDIDGESTKEILQELENHGFTILNAHFAGVNYDVG